VNFKNLTHESEIAYVVHYQDHTCLTKLNVEVGPSQGGFSNSVVVLDGSSKGGEVDRLNTSMGIFIDSIVRPDSGVKALVVARLGFLDSCKFANPLSGTITAEVLKLPSFCRLFFASIL
jgi:hypothetical protein